MMAVARRLRPSFRVLRRVRRRRHVVGCVSSSHFSRGRQPPRQQAPTVHVRPAMSHAHLSAVVLPPQKLHSSSEVVAIETDTEFNNGGKPVLESETDNNKQEVTDGLTVEVSIPKGLLRMGFFPRGFLPRVFLPRVIFSEGPT